MINFIIPFVIPIGLILIFRLINQQNRPAIFGVYQQKNKFYCLKFVFMYTFLRFRQLINHLKRLYFVEAGKSNDGTIHIHELDANLENKYYFGDHPKAIDAVYFNGISKEGEAFICGLARRPGNIVDSFVYLKLKDEGLLLSPVLPDTYQQQTDNEEGNYTINGLEIINFIPMRSWKINYKGEMKSRDNPGKVMLVEINLTWSATYSSFNYDTQMYPGSMARDLAREKWSKGYFKLLRKLHQTHYEQMGCMEGTVKVDGKEQIINMPCVRDHSFGPFRDWNTFHRYVYHFIFLDNGDSIAVGTVCQPSILSHLLIGYMCRKSDQRVYPIESSDFKLYHHGENQILPRDYAFMFTADKQTYTVQVQVDDEDFFYIGKSREAKFYERWCTVKINGVKGRACVEWQYNNVNTRKSNN